ncbi:MAG: hypothetical protein LC649_07530 [Bacteroidales bacterium]|nr:hypothetical protein [Bacteroidales bacterium]
MCFSAGASFAGGAVVTAIGIATVKRMRKPEQRLFSAIPLLFGLQQISEGFVWVALQNPGNQVMLNISGYLFLLAAVVIWPTMVPLAVLKMEHNPSRRRYLKIFLGAGIIISLYYGTGLIIHNVEPQISHHHIKYVNDFPRSLVIPVFILYLLATLIPLYISSIKNIYLFGILATISLFLTGIFFREYLTSVWCFFAAFISITVYWIISAEDRRLPVTPLLN